MKARKVGLLLNRPAGGGKLLLLAFLLAAWSASAWAALGDNVSSVDNDRVHMHASARVLHRSGFDVHEMTGAGRVVREFVSPAGKVFGVAWEGSAFPDMKQVLGNYFPQFQQAARTQRVRRGVLVIHEPGLVVLSAGHMRSFHGSAYVPGLLPSGVRAEDVR